jgi:hypothetical protein
MPHFICPYYWQLLPPPPQKKSLYLERGLRTLRPVFLCTTILALAQYSTAAGAQILCQIEQVLIVLPLTTGPAAVSYFVSEKRWWGGVGGGGGLIRLDCSAPYHILIRIHILWY